MDRYRTVAGKRDSIVEDDPEDGEKGRDR